ncbi:hypothetical protein [Legionella longbeachae]|uniref:Uncharacterized protein n=1 Tax=Legionella longbeachae serogroup 1 (strain NSW150) TaxID=661367 RepID=D3HKZ3_LEGLN|nr:hypothetical protein [Legionella longbeachae]VEE03620.1 Uncharacterised protein [Legionella oakridgensis]HBD7397574.1 hypothetical protein [Legionella pneumophila]ARM33400.3 hypothetical protein B0B39_07625 [Legionella longbeachae]QIN33320.1 hypothetical protein GCB94_14795 [Legionella longbeachae]QIN36620.1 hypothetical protein GCS73_13790 [Legionella longbeachae]
MMDSIQLALDVHLQKKNQYIKKSLLKHNHVSEETYPLLVSYFIWIRRVNSNLNKADELHQNEQINNEFNCLCKRNLLFFLTATKQFEVIEKLFSTPSFITRLHHSMICAKSEQNKVKQIRKKRLLQLIHQQHNKLTFLLEKSHHLPIENLNHCLNYFIHFAKRSLIKNVAMQDTDVRDYALTALRFFVEHLNKRNDFNHEMISLENSKHSKDKPLSTHKRFLLNKHSIFFASTEQIEKKREIPFRPTFNSCRNGHV